MSDPDPQLIASDPELSAFVSANAGSGKTTTLVDRVARLLLAGADPGAILCVTYTKAAASEMQRRLFDKLGDWAVMDDADLRGKLAEIGEGRRDPRRARRLFAKALETPGGLKIQTIHAFCEKLLRRFPLEAGVSPGFTLLEDAAAAALSAKARETVALTALERPESDLGQAYARLAVQVDVQTFEALFGVFEARREAIADFVAGAGGGLQAAVYALCGLAEVTPPAAVEAAILAELDRLSLDMAIEALRAGSVTDARLAERLHAWASAPAGFDAYFANFCTGQGEPLKSMATKAVDPSIKAWLEAEQRRLALACRTLKAARMAEGTLDLLYLAQAHAAAYEGEKAARRGLDFGDLIARARRLLTGDGAAAWVLYKLEGGVEHLLLDEAQDTAPEQWDIVRALTGEFFAGSGVHPKRRTVFAVGDPKQSIYSFQGAAPWRLLLEAQRYAALAGGAGQDFAEVPLWVSYRSTPQILAFVDAVFGPPEAQAALTPSAGDLPPGEFRPHAAHRVDHAGSVDVWPLEAAQDGVEPEAWWAPLDAEPPESAAKRLARRIAQEIAGMMARREAVFDKTRQLWRPMRPGDVLILVRRRKSLFHEIIRALKREGVPVGGQDRLTLSDHIVFKDLMALAAFARFPEDDLTLAALLRSPFTDIDEESLFDLAWNRKGERLWAVLRARAEERADWSAAHALLEAARDSAEATPFAFASGLLARRDAAGRSMRQRLLTRLGREAEDALDAFLAETLKLEGQGVRDLEAFRARMSASAIEVKREQEESGAEGPGEVQVMTVHGAKGLERPVVILPDTTSTARAQGPGFLAHGGGFLWAPRKDDDSEASAEARAARDLSAAQESLRLLYVALTRARDRLIICGVERADRTAGFEAGSWYEIISQALERAPLADDVRPLEAAGRTIRRIGPDPTVVAHASAEETAAAQPPAWARRAAVADPLARYASPTALAEAARGPAPSPLASRDGLGRYRRGTLIHRLLQVLPDLPRGERRPAADRLLAREHDLSPPQRTEMAAAALAVIEDPRFAAVFGPGGRAEAPIAGTAAGLPPGLSVSGRLDRLVVTPERVLVADFKTNRPAPARVEDADPGYILQMALYVAVLREAFPGRAVEAALVWTDGPKLMPVPENLIAEALAKLGRAG